MMGMSKIAKVFASSVLVSVFLFSMLPGVRAQGYHDVAVVGVSVVIPFEALAVFSGDPACRWKVNVSVVVENLGEASETFNVTLYFVDHEGRQNSTGMSPSGPVAVADLAPGERRTINYTWGTNRVDPCRYNYTGGYYVPYTVTANITTPIPGENDTTNNSGGDTLEVWYAGDANIFPDGWVTGSDLAVLGRAWYGRYPDPDYDWRADPSGDGAVTGTDLGILARHWYKSAKPA